MTTIDGRQLTFFVQSRLHVEFAWSYVLDERLLTREFDTFIQAWRWLDAQLDGFLSRSNIRGEQIFYLGKLRDGFFYHLQIVDSEGAVRYPQAADLTADTSNVQADTPTK